MSTARRLHYSYQEYLRTLELSDVKLDYWDGVIYAMAGGTPEHSALAAKVLSLLDARLPSGCRAFNSDLKVRIGDVSVFPDGAVVCGKVERATGDKQSIVNPGLIVEVTSASTEEYDRGEKLDRYKQLKSLQAVWIISHASRKVTIVERRGRGWRATNHGPGEELTLAAPSLTLGVDAIYRAIEGL